VHVCVRVCVHVSLSTCVCGLVREGEGAGGGLDEEERGGTAMSYEDRFEFHIPFHIWITYKQG
jgi:hypothetical protein